MNNMKSVVLKAVVFFIIFTLICGIVYTAVVTVLSQLIFPDKANGSIIEVDGKQYGCELLGQQYTDDEHMWGRIMNLDVSTYQDKEGKTLLYAAPSNLSPASAEYKDLVAQRVQDLKEANPEQGDQPIPVDLVTCSGSGLDPEISVAAAEYQIARLVENSDKSEKEIRDIVDKCTKDKLWGILGEKTVNVLKVNLMLDGILA